MLPPSWIEVGDMAPQFSARTDVNPSFAFGSMGGRWLVMLFFGSLADPVGRAAHEQVVARRALFDDTDASYFGVSCDPRDRTERGLKATPPGLRFFYDDDLAVSRLYNQDHVGGEPRMAVLLDRAMRVVAVEPLERTGALLERLELCLAAEPGEPAVLMAPVLTVPRVFEPELCQTLINYYEAKGGSQSGVMREINGLTVGVMDDSMKRRRDAKVEDPDLKALMVRRLGRRLIPEIKRAFNWQATRIERYMVACYDEEDRGFFKAHRDNTTAGTAHRVFAVSLNLNSDYDGGELCFPEFGPGTYRPPPGGATVFSCSLLHAATPVTRGTRYVFVPFLYDDAHARIRAANRDKLVTKARQDDETQAAE
jgi:predicted 2-oxoglutarate/Fe(II)-dependent dioxygenase YbiX/peroxiredoxin